MEFKKLTPLPWYDWPRTPFVHALPHIAFEPLSMLIGDLKFLFILAISSQFFHNIDAKFIDRENR